MKRETISSTKLADVDLHIAPATDGGSLECVDVPSQRTVEVTALNVLSDRLESARSRLAIAEEALTRLALLSELSPDATQRHFTVSDFDFLSQYHAQATCSAIAAAISRSGWITAIYRHPPLETQTCWAVCG